MPLSSYPHLSHLLDSDEAWQLLGDFDQLMLGAEAHIQSIVGSSDAVEAARLMHAFTRDHYHLFLVGQYKVREIARGIRISLEIENGTVLFSLARALVEHTAAMAYQVRKLEAAIDDLPKRTLREQFRATIERHHNHATALYYNERAKVHVNDMIAALKTYIVDIQSGYDQLCEFVHPNYGSNQLVSSGTLGSGKIGSNTALLAPEVESAHDLMERCAKLVQNDLNREVGYHLGKVSSWIEIASQNGVKLSQVFSTRGAVSGDGKTKETALHFQKARTHIEAMEALYAYLEINKLAMRQRQLAAVENGFLYDRVQTNRGTLWVKYSVGNS